MKATGRACALAFLLSSPAAAQGWEYLGSADVFMGQYFFKDSAGSLNGYSDVALQQARSFSPESGFYLSEHSIYTGFKQVNELAGGGTLFQQSLDNSLGFKWIRRFEGGYSLKPRIGVRNELFRETADEHWGKGLYDFWRYEGGLTWERKTRLGLETSWTYQLAYDLYYTHYPRFHSLSSQFGAALAAPTPGDHVLDTVTNQFSYRSDFDLPGFQSVWGLYSLSLVNFPDQKVVNSQGQYLSSLRSDAYQSLGGGYSKRFNDYQGLGRVRPVASVGLTFANLISDQNNFDTDPKRLYYIGGYYNYWEMHLSPAISAMFLRTQTTVRLGYDFGYRGYSSRQAQESDGSYTGAPLRQTTHSLSVDASHPILRNLDLRLRGLWSNASANTRYEQTYTYNYSSYVYFAGFEWRL